MLNMSITDRKSFMKFRQDWKAVYSFVSGEIRLAKKMQVDANPRSMSGQKTISKGQVEVAVLRKRARELMEDLESAKAMRPVRAPYRMKEGVVMG